jgi:hypothetical protein
MPTIEIVSINSLGLDLNQAEFDIALFEDNKLECHRGHFYSLLREQNGMIIHIGNPDLKYKIEGGFFAGQIIDWSFEPKAINIPEVDNKDLTENKGPNQQFCFKFLELYKKDIHNLLIRALDYSPIKKIYFLTDYQFGPEKGNLEIIYTVREFWTKHDYSGLTFNTMYELYGP